jgi:hypothetical protein
MRLRRWLALFTAGVLALAQVACSQPGSSSLVTQASSLPTTKAIGAALVAPTPTASATSTPANPAATRPPTGPSLTSAGMLAILQQSYGTYPRRLRLSSVSKSTNQASNSIIDSTDSDHLHLVSTVPMAQGNVVLEGIRISATLYMKPPDAAWRLANPDEQDLIGLLLLSANPGQAIAALGFTDAGVAANKDQKIFQAVGDEVVNAVLTTHYEQQAADPAGAGAIVNDIWVGVADNKAHKIVSDSVYNEDTTLLEYDRSITVTAPIP